MHFLASHLTNQRMTLEEIQPIFEDEFGEPLQRKQMRRYRDILSRVFDINIEYDKVDYTYHTKQSSHQFINDIRRKMMNLAQIGSLIFYNMDIVNKVILDDVPSASIHLETIFEAFRRKVLITITYRKYTFLNGKIYTVRPVILRLSGNRWYLVVEHPSSKVFTLCLDRIVDLKLTTMQYHEQDDEDIYRDCYGVFCGNDLPPAQEVVIRAYDYRQHYFNDLPLHKSQKVIFHCKEYADYMYWLRPGNELIADILRYGNQVEVISPSWLREKVQAQIISMALKYS